MPESTVDILIKVLPVLVGGFLALGGGFLSQIWISHLDQKKKNRELLILKSEEIVRALYAHSEWLDKKRSAIFSEETFEAPSPLSEIKMLHDLYFPSLDHEMLAIMQAEIPMVDLLGKQHLEKNKNLNDWLNNNKMDEYTELYSIYLLKFRDMVNGVTASLHAQIEN